MVEKEQQEETSQRPNFDFQGIQEKGMDMQCTKPPPGLKDEFPIKAFIDFDSQAKRYWLKNQTISMANYRYPAINRNVPLGVVFLKHGLFTYTELYSHIAQKYAKSGYDVVAFDMQGHGESEGKRGYIRNMQDLLLPHIQFEELVIDYYKEFKLLQLGKDGIPIFLSGQGLGAGICIQLAIKFPDRYAAISIFNPPIKQYTKETPAEKYAKVICIVAPKTKMKKFKEQMMCHNPQVEEYYQNNKLIFHVISQIKLITVPFAHQIIYLMQINKK